MPEMETIEVVLKYSKSGAKARINRNDFDPEQHALVEEMSAETPAPEPSTETPTVEGSSTEESTTESRGRRRY